MKTMRPAFTFIELTVSLALLALLSFYLSHFIFFIQKQTDAQYKQASRATSIALALDIARRDFICASTNLSDWHEQEGVFALKRCLENGQLASSHVAWSVEAGNLVRTEGEYNLKLGSWAHKSSHVVLMGIRSCELVLSKHNGRIRSITFSCQSSGSPVYQIFVACSS